MIIRKVKIEGYGNRIIQERVRIFQEYLQSQLIINIYNLRL